MSDRRFAPSKRIFRRRASHQLENLFLEIRQRRHKEVPRPGQTRWAISSFDIPIPRSQNYAANSNLKLVFAILRYLTPIFIAYSTLILQRKFYKILQKT